MLKNDKNQLRRCIMYVLTKRKSITAYTWSHCPDKTVAQLWQRDRASSAILRGG